MWVVGEWADYESGPTRITIWSDQDKAKECYDAWKDECARCKSIRIDMWDASVDSGRCPWDDNSNKEAEREAVLDRAIKLLRTGEVDCLFDALSKATKSDWNGGFGRGRSIVLWDGDRRSHIAYAATRLALPNSQQALMCFSKSASKEEMIDVLERAKNVEIK